MKLLCNVMIFIVFIDCSLLVDECEANYCASRPMFFLAMECLMSKLGCVRIEEIKT